MPTRNRRIIAAIVMALAVAAGAALAYDGIDNPIGRSAPPPPTCSYSLDFRYGCNSQYLGL